MDNDEQLFYRHRDRFNTLLASGEDAERGSSGTLLLSQSNGIQRTVPLQSEGTLQRAVRSLRTHPLHARLLVVPPDDWRAGRSRAEMSKRCRSAPEISSTPTRPTTCSSRSISKSGFTWRDQERTARLLARHDGPVILVNQATDRMERLYRSLGFEVRFLTGPRRISCTGDRTPAREIMGMRHL